MPKAWLKALRSIEARPSSPELVVQELLQNPPIDSSDLRTRVAGSAPGPLREVLVRRLLDGRTGSAQRVHLIQWIIELKPKNAAIRLLDALSDRSLPIEKRALAFIVLLQAAPRETDKRIATLGAADLDEISLAANSLLEDALRTEEVKAVESRAERRTDAEPRVCRMKITLRGTRPPVWRRFEVRDDMTLARLHTVIQRVMGWTDSHLHEFHVGQDRFGIPNPEWPDDTISEKKIRVGDLIDWGVKRFVYEYDFGDGWQHDIVIEKLAKPEHDVRYPRCLTGKRACPPEDCGGVGGYYELLEAIANPEDAEDEDVWNWADWFEPDAFDLEWVNQSLRKLKR